MERNNEDRITRDKFEKLERAFREQSLGSGTRETVNTKEVPASTEGHGNGGRGKNIRGKTDETQSAEKGSAQNIEQENSVRPRCLAIVSDYRVNLLDYDNLCAKPLIDCIRYAGFIPEDNPENLEILVRQKKVTRHEDIRLEIEIIRIENNWTIDAMFELPELIARLMMNDLTVLQDFKKLMTP